MRRGEKSEEGRKERVTGCIARQVYKAKSVVFSYVIAERHVAGALNWS